MAHWACNAELEVLEAHVAHEVHEVQKVPRTISVGQARLHGRTEVYRKAQMADLDFHSWPPPQSSFACRDGGLPLPPIHLPRHRRSCAFDALPKIHIVYFRDDIEHRVGGEDYRHLFFLWSVRPQNEKEWESILPRSHLTLRLRHGSQA